MNGVSFTKAADILPQFCFSAMQNVSVGDRQVVLDWIKLLKSDTTVEEEQKPLLLGLRLLNIVGREVLTKTVDGLGPRIRSSLHIGLDTLLRLPRVDFAADAGPVIALCYALAQGSIAVDREALGHAVDVIGGQPFDNEVKVLLLASELLKAFGDSVVGQALEMVSPGPPSGGGSTGTIVVGASSGGTGVSGAGVNSMATVYEPPGAADGRGGTANSGDVDARRAGAGAADTDDPGGSAMKAAGGVIGAADDQSIPRG